MYRFGSFELDEKAYTLTRNGQSLRLRPKLFDVLVHLIRHRDRVVTNRELLESVWGPEHVTPSVVPWTISRLRNALGQQGDRQSPIATIPRRGYRFQDTLTTDSAPPPAPPATPEAESERAASAANDAMFIGREDVLEALGSALASAHAGSGGFFLLVGEPGVGRTRCLQEFARRAKSDEASVWSAACASTPSTPTLWPWIQILHACAREESESSARRERVEALLATLQNELGEMDESADLGSFSLLAQLCTLLAEASAERTRVLLLDDLHDADKGSLRLLSLLAPRLADCRLLVVGTLQELSLAVERAQSPPLLGVRSQAQCLALTPWTRCEVSEFVSRWLPTDQRERVADAIWRRAQGNPLFIQELLQHYRMHGSAAGELAEIELASGGRNLPATLQNLIRQRLQSLSRKTTVVLGAASVIGRRFDLALLQRITEQPASALLGALDRAQLLGVVEPGERVADYAFKHELIRDAIYTDLPGQTRARLHLKVGEALEDPAFGSVTPSILAWHFYCAAPLGGAARAVHHAEQAARDARHLSSYSDEVRYREWALEAQAFSPTPSPAQRCELLIALATARTDLGEVDVARRYLARAVEIAEAGNLPESLARAGFILRSSMLISALPDPLALQALEHARRDLPEEARGMRARVASYLASIPPYSQSPEQRRKLIDEALSLAHASGESTPLFDALRARCAALTDPDHLDELLKGSQEIDALAERIGSPRMLHESQQYRYLALLQLGRPIEDSSIPEKLERSSGRHALREARWLYGSLQVRHMFYRGHLQRAEQEFRQLHALRSGVRSWLSDLHFAMGLGLMHVERDSVKEYWAEFLEVTQGWQRGSHALAALSMRMLLAQGRVAEVRSEIERSGVDALIRRPLTMGQLGELGVLSQLSLIMVELGDWERCKVLYERMLPYAQLCVVDELWFSFGSMAHFLGVLAAAYGDPEAARRHLENALERNTALRYRVQAAWTRYELARTLLGLGEPQRARTLLAQVEQDARKCDLRVLQRCVQSLDVQALALRSVRRPPTEIA